MTNFRSGFSLLFLAQVLSKLLPFLFNSVFVYGTISSADGVGDTLVMFPLVYAFVLSIRDGLRRSLLRGRTFRREEGESEDDDEDIEYNENDNSCNSAIFHNRTSRFCSLVDLDSTYRSR